MEEENKIDHLFKKGLNDPQIPFNEMDWEKMEQKLDAAEKKRRLPVWIFSAAGIAAVVLVVLFWFLMKPVEKGLIPAKEKEVAGAFKPVERPVVVPENEYVGLGNTPGKIGVAATKGGVMARPVVKPHSKNDLIEIPSLIQKDSIGIEKEDRLIAAVVKPGDSAISIPKVEELAQVKEQPVQEDPVKPVVVKKPEIFTPKKPGLVLSVMAAPDLSAAEGSRSSKLSSNFGVLATYSLTRKLSLTSGVIYSRKFYNSGGVNGKWNTYTVGNAWEVDADCNVLDIPLNVNYKLLDKKMLSISVNTGLSSYFMLTEKYKFIKNMGSPSEQISTLQINNENRHLFGVANISLNFEHRITKGVSVGVQPFVKIPLTGIGFGNANLKSTGMSFSLNLGLFR